MHVRLFALAALVLTLAACGATPLKAPLSPQSLAGTFEAEATKTLLAGFKHIHMAAYARIDANANGEIDEYEAGSSIDLKDFTRADRNRNGRLSKREFMDYATGGSVFGFLRQDRVAFMKQTRDVLWRAFQRLDGDRDRQLKPAELNEKALQKVGIHLRIDGLRLRVALNELDDATFEASDKTGGGTLSQAEFEDYCITSFVKAINPNYQMGPIPAPAPAEPVPADPVPGEEPAGGEDPDETER
ncbi:MAG: hypothetical protein VKP62_08270 [Candidatus Sericytochromatia bacterium]|nr:hypothetical protein [Candidatus Sericytochromatia bacterium]